MTAPAPSAPAPAVPLPLLRLRLQPAPRTRTRARPAVGSRPVRPSVVAPARPRLARTAYGQVLRSARQDRGMTLRQAADDAGVSLGYLSEVERGCKEVSSELLRAMAGSVGLPLPDLIRRAADLLDA